MITIMAMAPHVLWMHHEVPALCHVDASRVSMSVSALRHTIPGGQYAPQKSVTLVIPSSMPSPSSNRTRNSCTQSSILNPQSSILNSRFSPSHLICRPTSRAKQVFFHVSHVTTTASWMTAIVPVCYHCQTCAYASSRSSDRIIAALSGKCNQSSFHPFLEFVTIPTSRTAFRDFFPKFGRQSRFQVFLKLVESDSHEL